MAADPGQLADFRFNVDMLVKQAYLPGAFYNGPAQGSYSLIAYKKNGGSGPLHTCRWQR